jgi:two-component system phosphate regulon response regulator PhoB
VIQELPMSRVLVVEDEMAIAELIALNLRHAGFEVTVVDNGEDAQTQIDKVMPDLVLLDWMLPGQSGLTLAKRWRGATRTRDIPIIMLTARAEEADKVAGLDAGADDYLTKPFSPHELMARVRASCAARHPRLWTLPWRLPDCAWILPPAVFHGASRRSRSGPRSSSFCISS